MYNHEVNIPNNLSLLKVKTPKYNQAKVCVTKRSLTMSHHKKDIGSSQISCRLPI